MSDDQISVLRAINQGLSGLRRDVSDGLAALIPPGSVIVTGGFASGASSVDIDMPQNAAIVEIDALISAVTDGSDLRLQVMQGGVAVTGATDYSYATIKGTTQSTSGGASFGLVGPAADATLSQIKFRIVKPGDAVRHYVTWTGVLLDSAASLPQALNGGVRFGLNTNPISGLRFLASAGNITMDWVMRATVE